MKLSHACAFSLFVIFISLLCEYCHFVLFVRTCHACPSLFLSACTGSHRECLHVQLLTRGSYCCGWLRWCHPWFPLMFPLTYSLPLPTTLTFLLLLLPVSHSYLHLLHQIGLWWVEFSIGMNEILDSRKCLQFLWDKITGYPLVGPYDTLDFHCFWNPDWVDVEHWMSFISFSLSKWFVFHSSSLVIISWLWFHFPIKILCAYDLTASDWCIYLPCTKWINSLISDSINQEQQFLLHLIQETI